MGCHVSFRVIIFSEVSGWLKQGSNMEDTWSLSLVHASWETIAFCLKRVWVQVESAAPPGSPCLRWLGCKHDKHTPLLLALNLAELPRGVSPSELSAGGAQQTPYLKALAKSGGHAHGVSPLLPIMFLCPIGLQLQSTIQR